MLVYLSRFYQNSTYIRLPVHQKHIFYIQNTDINNDGIILTASLNCLSSFKISLNLFKFSIVFRGNCKLYFVKIEVPGCSAARPLRISFLKFLTSCNVSVTRARIRNICVVNNSICLFFSMQPLQLGAATFSENYLLHLIFFSLQLLMLKNTSVYNIFRKKINLPIGVLVNKELSVRWISFTRSSNSSSRCSSKYSSTNEQDGVDSGDVSENNIYLKGLLHTRKRIKRLQIL